MRKGMRQATWRPCTLPVPAQRAVCQQQCHAACAHHFSSSSSTKYWLEKVMGECVQGPSKPERLLWHLRRQDHPVPLFQPLISWKALQG